MGSLLPLSNSRMGHSLCFSPMPCERSKLKTDAESVDDMVAAKSSETISES